MVKLLRAALTAAVLVAIAVRLRRRLRRGTRPAPPPAAEPRVRLGALGVTVATVVGIMGGLAWLGVYVRTGDGEPEARLRGVMMSDSSDGWGYTEWYRGDGAEDAGSSGWTPPDPSAQAIVVDYSCTPERRPPTVRPLDPRVRRAVDRQWRRIERWLKANAPRTYATLGRPGRARTIAVAESQMGVDFPDDLRASLLRHNGATGFGLGVRGAVNLSIRQIRDLWRRECELATAYPGAARDWHGGMVPFVSMPDGGPEGYRLGVIDPVRGVVGAAPSRPSYHHLLREVADALETGGDLDGARPVVVAGTLVWR
ncbi:SMI1/KNR4 family protein [Thermoactinospora rubra]|uniref:SMI1/KNR4 family protein n=1 Tax=Thermoactinospora rubra TaxID=1088767 RepID=UPI000A0FE0EE|nr:SMI1/KNR4 family protein [Thermoactinospora rubra]